MRRGLLTLGAAFFLTSPMATGAQEPTAAEQTALTYLTTLYDFDFVGLAGQLHVDAVFSDPTATPLAGSDISYTGRAEIVESFEATAAGSRNPGFEIERQFVSGEYVVFTLRYRAELKGEGLGLPGAWVPVEVPAVTVLRVVDGLIAEHVDYVGYDEMLRQIADFAAGSAEHRPEPSPRQ